MVIRQAGWARPPFHRTIETVVCGGLCLVDSSMRTPGEGKRTGLSPQPSGVRRVGLTGVHGFIGNRVLLDGHALLHHEVEFVGADLLGSEGRATAQRTAGLSRYRFMPHLAFLEALESGALLPDLVIHNGACSTTTETDPRVFRDLNVMYSTRLWAACARQRIPLIFASSASVYGNGEQGFDDDPVKTAAYSALNLYGRSKLDFDRHALAAQEYPPCWCGLRYFNVYGFDESHKGAQASMVLHGTRQALATGVIRLFQGDDRSGGRCADGEQKRDFVSVEDVSAVTWRLAGFMCGQAGQDWKRRLEKVAEPEGPVSLRSGTFLNVGTGRARTWNDLARAVFLALGRSPSIEYIAMPMALRAHYQNFTEAKHTMADRLGLAMPWLSLEQGAGRYVAQLVASSA